MTELMQGRDLDSLDGFETPTFDMSIVADSFNLESHFVDSNGKLGFGFLSAKKSFEFAPWRYEGEGREDEFDFLIAIAKELEKQIYIREYDYLGFYACQILIPSLSEVYPIEDLIYNNKNSGKAIRDMVLNFGDYDAEDILDAIEPLDASLDVGKYIGVLFKEPFTMADFKAQTYLLLGERELAQELLELGTNKLARVVAELMRMEDEGLDFEEYEEGLCAIFTQSAVKKAVAILAGEQFLVYNKLHNNYTNMLAMYDKLSVKKENMLR
jgi:ribosomal protein S12 methylthiotransferase accessory factor